MIADNSHAERKIAKRRLLTDAELREHALEFYDTLFTSAYTERAARILTENYLRRKRTGWTQNHAAEWLADILAQRAVDKLKR